MARRRRQETGTRRGMTLIETVMLITVMGVALPPMLGTMIEVTRKSMVPECRVIATNLIRDKMEELVHLRHDKGYTDSGLATGTVTENPVSGFAGYTRTVTVSEASERKTVSVTVNWSGGSLNATTIFAYF